MEKMFNFVLLLLILVMSLVICGKVILRSSNSALFSSFQTILYSILPFSVMVTLKNLSPNLSVIGNLQVIPKGVFSNHFVKISIFSFDLEISR